MKKSFAFILFICSALGIHAQDDSLTNDILTTKKFRYGIYVKSSEFKTNSPRIETGFSIKGDTGRFDRYTLIYENGKRVRDVFGFCDGHDLFISAQVYNDAYGAANYFAKILLLGPIIYFEDQAGKTLAMRDRHTVPSAMFLGSLTGSLLARAVNSGVSRNPGWIMYLPDEYIEGWVLDKRSLLSIFEEANPELYKKFNQESKQNDFETLLNYVQEFNKQALTQSATKK